MSLCQCLLLIFIHQNRKGLTESINKLLQYRMCSIFPNYQQIINQIFLHQLHHENHGDLKISIRKRFVHLHLHLLKFTRFWVCHYFSVYLLVKKFRGGNIELLGEKSEYIFNKCNKRTRERPSE